MQQGKAPGFSTYLPYLTAKAGLEIGGPSDIFRRGHALPVYEEIGSLDNCDFSRDTVWAAHSDSFCYSPTKVPGLTLFCDGSALVDVPDAAYDVVLSSHNLEHFANPVRALVEWQRVLRPSGALILVLPYYRATFDHRRQPTPVEHMMTDFEQETGEDDLTHLPEILEKHDLRKDPGAGTAEQFSQRSLDNLANRCLHHHVFDEQNAQQLLHAIGFSVLSFDHRLPYHMCFLAKKD